MLRLAVCVLLALGHITVSADAPSGHWPQWRGPNRDNVSADVGLLTEWPAEGPPLQWTVSGIGNGIAAVAVAEGRIITLGDIDGHECVMALDEQTGRRLWATVIGPAVADSGVMRLMRWLSQRTPTIDGDRLYALTAKGALVCLSTADGNELWKKDYRTDFGCGDRIWGFCDYPLVDGDSLICLPLGSLSGIVALNKFNGNVIWHRSYEQSREPAYAAILPTTIEGTKQHVATVDGAVVAFSAADGSLLWRSVFSGGRSRNTHTPTILPDGDIFCPIEGGLSIVRFGVRRESGSWQVAQRYKRKAIVDPFQDGSVVVGDHVYLGLSGGMLSCVSLQTGEETWRYRPPREQNDAPEGRQARRSSTTDGPSVRGLRGSGRFAFRSRRVGLTYADGNLYCLRADGSVQLIRPDPTGYVEAFSFKVPDFRPGVGATLPVVTGGQLYLRDDDRLLCFDVRDNVDPADRRVPVEFVLPKPVIDPSEEPQSARNPIFVTTPHAIVEKMLDVADVDSDDVVVVDLGSGDGRIVVAAAKRFGCRAIGYEIDTELVMQARDKVDLENLSELVTIRHQDMFTADLRDADVVTVYLYPEVLAKLRPQLMQMKAGSRIVSHLFEIPGVEPSKRLMAESDTGEQHRVSLYVLPLE